MLNISSILFILILIPLALIMLNLLMNKNSISREKKTPFECGFDPMSTSRIPMSSQFFLVGLVFLVFDVEITLLIPMILIMKKFSMPMITTSAFFLIILIGGIFFEYTEQSIEWKM
nr:TPA_asm: NADH dehydrogenase subunit 3 [Pseudomyrmex veneficus]